MSRTQSLLLALGAATAFAPSVDCAVAQGISGQAKELTHRHGPWMIQVATLRSAEGDERATRAARLLVTELRSKGLPAYAVSRIIESRGDDAVAAQTDTVVLVGNYENSESSTARRTLAYIQRLQDTPTAKQLAKSTGEPSPFKDAYIRRNPLVEAIDVGRAQE